MCNEPLQHYPDRGICPDAELQLLLLLHRLLDCKASHTTAGPNGRPAALTSLCDNLVAVSAPYPAFAANVAELVGALTHDPHSVDTRERLLRFLVCPTRAEGAPAYLLRTMVEIAGAFLWGEVRVVVPVDLHQPPAEGAGPMPPPGAW